TAEGLSLFDGYRFTNFGVDQGLPHPVVNQILQTTGGEYWVATDAGLSRFDPNGVPANSARADTRATVGRNPMFTVLRPNVGDRPGSAFNALLQGRDGTIWCGTRNGLFQVARTGAVIKLIPVDIGLMTTSSGRSISALLEDRHGTLWIGAASGLYRRWADGS